VFEGFTEGTLPLGHSSVFFRQGGDGPPVVLLHGHPRTSATWHRVAPLLVAAGRTVVCPDLRGYGRSRGPAPAPDHRPHSKRAMAEDLHALLDHLGLERVDLVGHDRGSYAAFRLALDSPERIRTLVLIDCIPIVEHLERITPEFATAWWHWFFYAQPDKPERAVLADPDGWYGGDPEAMGLENFAERRSAIHDPDVVRAMIEDYRAGLTVDADDERADRAAGRQLEPPLLALWSERDDLVDLFGDPVAIWRDWARDVRGHGIDSGHHVAEEQPEQLAAALLDFIEH